MNIDIKHIAKLARLRIEDDQLDKFESEMENIVGMVEKLPDIQDEMTLELFFGDYLDTELLSFIKLASCFLTCKNIVRFFGHRTACLATVFLNECFCFASFQCRQSACENKSLSCKAVVYLYLLILCVYPTFFEPLDKLYHMLFMESVVNSLRHYAVKADYLGYDKIR